MDLPPQYSVRDTHDLAEMLKNRNLSLNYFLLSFDVTSLHTEVPLVSTLMYIETLLRASNIPFLIVENFITFLKQVLLINFFQFNNNTYKFPKDFLMSSPLAPLIAKIFMDLSKTEVFAYYQRVLVVSPHR